jgi:hypothetical protein
LKRFKDEIKEPRRIEIYDEIQSRRAYFLADLGKCDKALPALEEIKDRRNDDTIFLFYLEHCYCLIFACVSWLMVDSFVIKL